MEDLDNPAVLVVDDDEVLRTLVGILLAKVVFPNHEYTVVTVGTYAEALEQIFQAEFNLLIVDKNLPDGSGIDIVRTLREEGHNTRAILITAESDNESVMQDTTLNISSCMTKPFDVEEMGKEIIEALKKP